MQGWLRAAGKPLRTPAQARTLLRTTGSPQQNEPGRPATQRIGNRPNLRSLHAQLFPKVVFKESKDIEKFKEHVKDFKEVGEKHAKEFDKGKEFKEFKEFKEGKEIKEKDLVEGGLGGGLFRPPEAAAATDLDMRLGALEATVASLVQALQVSAGGGEHFIQQQHRPDVGVQGTEEGSDADPDGQH
jgi:hypothetical protein